jgi:Fic family protein
MKPFSPQYLPIKNINWEQLAPLIGNANRSLSFYHGILQGVKNSSLLLSPITTQEAVLSSRIEGTEATLADVLRFEAGQKAKNIHREEDINEIINYRKALHKAEIGLQKKPFNLNLLKDLHSILLDSVRGKDKARGEFRRIQNWIGLPGSKIEEASFIPPAPTDLMNYMDNWEKFYHAEGIDPLVQLSLIHAQFEIIHPFLDGNGRIGRMLVPLFLYEKKLLSHPIFYLSEYLETHRDEYYIFLRNLGQLPDGWNEWISFFLKAINQQAESNSAKARAIIDLYNKLKERVIILTHSQHAIPLLDCIFDHPIFKISNLKWKLMPTRPMVTTLVTKLNKDGILKVLREGSGRRGSIYVFEELLRITESPRIPLLTIKDI